MARMQAALRLDNDRQPEQMAFLEERVRVLQRSGDQLWVSLEESQVDTLLGQGIQVFLHPEAETVELASLVFRPAEEAPEPPEALRGEEPAGEEPGFYLIHFRAPPGDDEINAVADLGGEYLQPIPNQAGVFRLLRAQAAEVRALPEVDFLGVFHPAYAVGLGLCGCEESFGAASFRNMQVTLPEESPGGNMTVRCFDGLDPEGLRSGLEAAGAEIVEETSDGFMLNVAQARAHAVLRVPGIFAADPAFTASVTNNNAGVIVGANQVRALGTVNFLVNLDGRGEIAGVVDSGFDVGNLAGATPSPLFAGAVFTPFHTDLRTNIRLLRRSTNPQNAALSVRDQRPPFGPHGTHVAGTIAGDGSNSAGQVRGIAPNASLVALGPLPSNFRRAFEFAHDHGARLINNSWEITFSIGGVTIPSNNRYLGNIALALDRFCFIHPETLVLFAAGNDERDTGTPPTGTLDRRRLSLMAVAKNVFAVGASENLRNDGGWPNDFRSFFGGRYNNAAFVPSAAGAPGTFSISDTADSVALFSCRGTVRTAGNANTNRVKPDIVAPGTNVLSARSQNTLPPPPLPAPPFPVAFLNANSDTIVPAGINRNLYQVFMGTSMATPMTTGSAVLVRQFYRGRFSQLRRPLLLEGVPVPAAPPLPRFFGIPAEASHADGLVFAWITPVLPAGTKDIKAMRLTRSLAPLDVAPVLLKADVGDHAALKLARRGDLTYLLHRHKDGSVVLSCYDRALAPVAAFGTAGEVTVTPAARDNDEVTPDLRIVGDHVACAYPEQGGNGYRFRRYRADTGAPVEAGSLEVLQLQGAGPHRTLVHDGSRYTLCGMVNPLGTFWISARQVAADGTLVGDGPVGIWNQGQAMREPSIIWNSRVNSHVVVWVDTRNQAGGEIFLVFLDRNARRRADPTLVLPVPAAGQVRNPRLFLHPDRGYILIWEEDVQNAHFDVYLTFLDAAGVVDGRIPPDPNDTFIPPRRMLRLSDTPEHTEGFAAFRDARGLSLIFQSPDEVNSDVLGVYALNLTPGGAFEGQEDPNTPLLKSGQYGTVELHNHPRPVLESMSAVYAGGSFYLLRLQPGVPAQDDLQWVRLTADGLPDPAFGVGGVRTVPVGDLILSAEIFWSSRFLAGAVNDLVRGITLFLNDNLGAPLPAFGVGGAAALLDTVNIHDRIPPQLGIIHGPPLRVAAAYGTVQGANTVLRFQRIDDHGVRVGNAVDLAQADGVARHGWYHFVNSENRSVAIYHRTVGAVTRVHARRFQAGGAADGVERNLSAAAGEGINGVLAPRPTAVNSTNREYGAVWQFRAAPAAPWEIHFCRLNRQGVPQANPPNPAPNLPVRDFTVISAGADWPADRQATEPQLLCTFTHEPWATPPVPVPAATPLPQWSPSYGLAWIGEDPDGSRVLYFTVLDENGRRLMAPQPPPVGAGPFLPPAQIPLAQVSATGSSVRDFRLTWNGRIFLLFWCEQEGGTLRYKCSALNRHANQRAYDLPSAALLRTTLVNGATNFSNLSLPDAGGNANASDGYGWGRVNLRQSLSPLPPATLYVRDDCALGPGRAAIYRFTLPAGTALLRVTLNWTDPPGARLINFLHLTVHAPAPAIPLGAPRPEFRGNLWDPAAGRLHLSRPVAVPAVPADNHEDIQTFKQVVINAPTPGVYDVEVSWALSGLAPDPFNQQNLQPFALVFMGSGPELRFNLPVAAVNATGIY